jgi:hypothetical protein
MGTVHRFPAECVRGALYRVSRTEAAKILILPVIQIEREAAPDQAVLPGIDAASSGAGHGPNGGRRRRGPRP